MVTSTNKGLSEPASGALNWNTDLNGNFEIIDKALGASTPGISLTGLTTYAVTTAQTPYMSLNFTGSPTSNVTVTIPTGVGGQWVVRNNTTKTLTFSSLGGGGGTAMVPIGSIRSIYCDGTNVYFADSQSGSVDTEIAYSSGGTLTGSLDLTFNGAVMSVGGTAAITGWTSSAGTFKATFNADKLIPVGSYIFLTSVTTTPASPNGFNSAFVVTASTQVAGASTATFADPGGIGTAPAGGNLSYGNLKVSGTNVVASGASLNLLSNRTALSSQNIDENRTASVTSTTVDDGTKTTGTYTPTPLGGNFKKIINNAGTVATTAASCVGTVATITYGGTFSFMVGSTVTVAGVTPTGYNGTWVVTASSAGSVSFAVPATLTAGTVQGTVTNGFFLAAPILANDYTMVIQVTNSATAGAINLSGFTRKTGDALTLTNASKFFIFITKCNGLTLAVVQALQ